MRLFVSMLLVTVVVMATLIDDSASASTHKRSLLDVLEEEQVSNGWKQVATHENGLPYNLLGSPMFVAPRPTDTKAIDLMCRFIQETPLLPNVEHDDEDVTAPNWDLLYADRSEDAAVCCQMEGNEQELCIEALRQKAVDQYCYFWDHSMENDLGVNEPCCEETGEGRVQCMDQARYGFDVDIHSTDRSIEILPVTVVQRVKQQLMKVNKPPAFDNNFCTWAKQQPHVDTAFEEATLQRLDPMQKISEVTRKLISCCYINGDEPTIDKCLSSVREESLDQMCLKEKVVDTAVPLIDPSVITNIPAGLKAIMSYNDDIPAHPCCQRSYINRYSCFSQEWRGFEASMDTLDHTAEIAQYKEKYNQLKSKIAAKIDFEKTSCDTWYGGKVLPESVEEIKPEVQYPSDQASTQEIIDYINSINTTWKAGQNFEGWTEADLKGLCGTILDDPDKDKIPFKLHDVSNLELPAEFDSRTQWPGLIHPIRNQQQCGSCWAFSASEVLSDRFAIATKTASPALSPQDMVSCEKDNFGCQGGYLPNAWEYLKDTGVVTESCLPYTSGWSGQVPSCSSSCIPGSTGVFQKYKASEIYGISSDVQQIQMEIMNNGPVETAFTVYSDFMSYQSGIYQHTSGKQLGGHAVRIVGWGKEGGDNYWTVANSWGPNWGERGFFRIGMGECGFGESVYAGQPLLS